MFFNYPYTDLYSLNLDWIIKAIRELQDKIDEDRGERVLSFNTRTGVVTLEAADVNGLTINAVGISPDLSAVTPAEMEEAFTAGIRVLLEVSAAGYQKAGFLVNTVDGVEMLPLTADVSELEDKVEEIDAKVNPEGAAPGDVLTVNDAGETEWAAQDNSLVSLIAPIVTGNTHPVFEANDYFIYNNLLRQALVDISADAAITDSNSTLVTAGGLSDVLNNSMSAFTQLDEQINPEGGGTPGTFLQVDSEGTTVWGPPASAEAIGAAVTDWLDTNVPTGTTVVVDKSLTIADAAADSQVVGNELSDLKSAIDYDMKGIVMKVDNRITVTGSSTVRYPFTVGKKYLVTNNSETSISFRTRLSPSSSNVEQMTVNAGLSKVFSCTLPADGINIYTSGSSLNVTVQQMDTLEYRTTDNTKRIEALESDGVPSYFRTMMDAKLPQIRANMNETGKNGDSFVFITDIHWRNNAKHSLGLIKYIIDNTNINKVLCGGDIISQGTVENMMNDMNAVIKGLEFPFHNDLLVAFGNHDSNILSTVADSHFDLNTCYAIMEKEAESYITMMTDYDLSFYYDSKSNNTRYIVLDTGEDSGQNNRVFTAYQEFANTLIDTPTGWNIIIMAHIVTYGKFAYIKGMMDAYNSKGTYTNPATGTFDFAEAQGKIICAFGGHTHVDSTDATTGGIPIIVTGTDSNRVGDDPEYPYVLGTDQEQSFDVVTINYTAKTIKCVRIGRGVDRTLSYQ